MVLSMIYSNSIVIGDNFHLKIVHDFENIVGFKKKNKDISKTNRRNDVKITNRSIAREEPFTKYKTMKKNMQKKYYRI